MNILFVCKYNNFRSKFAASVFNEKNTNPVHVAKSAGLQTNEMPGQEMIDEIQLVARKVGYNIVPEKTAYDVKAIDWADVIINVASDVELENISDKKMISWNIDDAPNVATIDSRIEVVLKVKQKVLSLIEELDM